MGHQNKLQYTMCTVNHLDQIPIRCPYIWIWTDNVNVALESVQKRLAGPTKSPSQGATREYNDEFLT